MSKLSKIAGDKYFPWYEDVEIPEDYYAIMSQVNTSGTIASYKEALNIPEGVKRVNICHTLNESGQFSKVKDIYLLTSNQPFEVVKEGKDRGINGPKDYKKTIKSIKV